MTITEARTRANDIFKAARKEGGEIADGARSATDHVQVAVMGAIDHVPEAMDNARSGASQIAEHFPAAAARARVAAHDTETALQTMPDPTLRLLAAGSIGMAAGLYVAGARRALTLAALASALIVSSAIATRPSRI